MLSSSTVRGAGCADAHYCCSACAFGQIKARGCNSYPSRIEAVDFHLKPSDKRSAIHNRQGIGGRLVDIDGRAAFQQINDNSFIEAIRHKHTACG